MTTLDIDELQTPDNPDNFRLTVDWGRWYVDPLPACTIAPATEDRWPSYSQVKGAAGKDWSFLTVNRIAALDPAELHRIANLDHTQRGDAIRSHEKMAKNIAFGRGTIIHLWAEDLGAGREPRTISDRWLAANRYPTAARDEAEIYRAALADFFNTYQPEPVAVEYVTIHRTLNGHGYGCTPDGLFRIEGELAGLDWKTRGESSSHAAYPEEAAQIAAAARAQYMIVREGDSGRRQHIPHTDIGYVVSIKPDGARLYPIDIDKAWNHFQHLHQWWVHRLDEKDAIHRVKPKRSAPTNTRRLAAVRMADDAGRAPAPVVAPDEGAPVADEMFAQLEWAYDTLTPTARGWFRGIVIDAKHAGVDFRAQNHKTQRRYNIYHGLIRLALNGYDNDTVALGLVEEATGDEAVNFANVTLGHAIGSMNAAQAATFSKLVDEYVG